MDALLVSPKKETKVWSRTPQQTIKTQLPTLLEYCDLQNKLTLTTKPLNETHIAASVMTALSSHTSFNFFSWYNLLLTNKKIGI